jgi:hypothetical protein
MATIYHQVGIKAPLNDVYKAIATKEGVTGWWTNISGDLKHTENSSSHLIASMVQKQKPLLQAASR